MHHAKKSIICQQYDLRNSMIFLRMTSDLLLVLGFFVNMGPDVCGWHWTCLWWGWAWLQTGDQPPGILVQPKQFGTQCFKNRLQKECSPTCWQSLFPFFPVETFSFYWTISGGCWTSSGSPDHPIILHIMHSFQFSNSLDYFIWC